MPIPEGGSEEQLDLADDLAKAAAQPLGRFAAAGTLWLTGQKWVARVSGFVTIAILARLIAPADFGVVAAALAVTPFVLLLADLGLATFVVQADRLDDRILSTGFWFSLSAGVVLSLGLVAVAPLIQSAFGLTGAVPVLRAMSLSVLVVVISSVPMALMRRRMLFRHLAAQATVATFVAQVVAVVLALRGFGVWALVAQIIVSQTIAGVLAWRTAAWRPQLLFSWPLFKTMARFGSKVLAVEVVAAARVAGEAAIISNVLGAAALGYLSIAQRLVQTAMDLSASALFPVSTVVFAKVRESKDRLRDSYLRALSIGYAAVSPLMTMLAVGAPLIVPLVFGPDWGESVPVVQALAVASIITLGAMIDHGLHYGLGRPGRWLAYAVVIDFLTLCTTAVLAPHGLTAVAVGFIFVALAATSARWVLIGRLVGHPAWRLAAVFAKAAVAVLGSAAAGVLVLSIASDFPAILALALVAVAIGVVHLGLVRLVSPSVLRDITRLIPISSRFGRAAS